METFKIDKKKFKQYINTLIKFEKEINSNYKKAKEKKLIKDNGYLIDKKSLDDFKTILNYSEFTSLSDPDFNEKMDKIFKDKNEIECIPLEQKIFKTSKELVDCLKKNNEYIIINSKILEIIITQNDKDKGKISYEIKENEIIINLGLEEKSFFRHNMNIINYNVLLMKNGINAYGDSENKKIKDKIDKNQNKAQIFVNNGNEKPIKLFNNVMNSDKNLIIIDFFYLRIIMKKILRK